MAPGMKTGGRTKGTPNRRSTQKAMIEEILRATAGQELIGKIAAEQVKTALAKAAVPPTKGSKKAVDHLHDLLLLSMNCVALYQPKTQPDGTRVISEPDRLQQYATLAERCAADLARFQSPTFKAIALTEAPPPPAAKPGDDAKVIDSIGKRSQQDAANVYMRLVRRGQAA